MNQYTLAGRERTLLMSLMILGLVCMGITFFTDDPYHTRFWSNFLHNSVFFTGVAFLALMFYAANMIALSGWHVVFKRLWEAYSLFLIVGLALMLVVIVGLWLHGHHLYHWADKEAVMNDEILKGKSGFLNPVVYTLFTIGFVGLWYFFALKLRAFSLEEDGVSKWDFTIHKKKMRVWASWFLPIGGFTSAAIVWQWVMSIDAHWYSTLFAWYCTISWFVSMLCITVLTLIYLKGKGYYPQLKADHFHDLGKYVFGFSVFWTYLWFSQYMLIWYGNVGEETIYFRHRFDNYPVLFYGNLVINFVLPFLVLLRNDTKRKMGVMSVICTIVLLGHWIDYFLMIKPGALHTAHEMMGHSASTMQGGEHGGEAVAQAVGHGAETAGHAVEHASNFVAGFTIPGLLEIGTFVGFAALFAYFFLTQLAKAPLVAKQDPYIDESLHHHVV
ncbi:MAG: hypothetical protein KDC80_20200 [Saprospiraceae bacterium]|nr:hypothetical protein [Saprospiraceae bacterium]